MGLFAEMSHRSAAPRSLLLAGLLVASGHAASATAAIEGEGIYHRDCAVCHGDSGDGQSRARNSLVPPPRDFTTPSAAVELTRERLLASVTHGRPGTAMAAWQSQLDGAQIEAVVDFIMTRFILPASVGDTEQGRRLYADNCSVCHGDNGAGAVWTAASMNPPPRNFRSPAAGVELSRERMVQSVTYGRADTAMPGFGSQLSEDEILAVVDYVRSAFIGARETGQEPAGPTAPVSPMSAAFDGGLQGDPARGQAFYLANCATCHGVEGDGKGPRAYFILPKPRNFRHAASRHRLNRPTLYEAIAKGRLRTEMPAWDKVLTGQEIADVAEYVFQAFIVPVEAER